MPENAAGNFREYDVVRVARLRTETRYISGTPGGMRQPIVGDLGTIVMVYDGSHLAVESVDSKGMTVWLADFTSDELELVMNSHDS
jgi:hypothetical protein